MMTTVAIRSSAGGASSLDAGWNRALSPAEVSSLFLPPQQWVKLAAAKTQADYQNGFLLPASRADRTDYWVTLGRVEANGFPDYGLGFIQSLTGQTINGTDFPGGVPKVAVCRYNGSGWDTVIPLTDAGSYVAGNVHDSHMLSDGSLLLVYRQGVNSAVIRGTTITLPDGQSDGWVVLKLSPAKTVTGWAAWARPASEGTYGPGTYVWMGVDPTESYAYFSVGNDRIFQSHPKFGSYDVGRGVSICAELSLSSWLWTGAANTSGFDPTNSFNQYGVFGRPVVTASHVFLWGEGNRYYTGAQGIRYGSITLDPTEFSNPGEQYIPTLLRINRSTMTVDAVGRAAGAVGTSNVNATNTIGTALIDGQLWTACQRFSASGGAGVQYNASPSGYGSVTTSRIEQVWLRWDQSTCRVVEAVLAGHCVPTAYNSRGYHIAGVYEGDPIVFGEMNYSLGYPELDISTSLQEVGMVEGGAKTTAQRVGVGYFGGLSYPKVTPYNNGVLVALRLDAPNNSYFSRTAVWDNGSIDVAANEPVLTLSWWGR